MHTPTDLTTLPNNIDLRLVAVDMDGTLLDDSGNFPPKLDELLDALDARGVVFAPASGRQVWTLIDMFPQRPGMTVIGENGAIVMKDGREVSSYPLDHDTIREAIRLVRDAVNATGLDGGLVMCGKRSAYVERSDTRFVEGVLPYYHRTETVSDQFEVLERIESGELDDDIVKLAVMCLDNVLPLAERTLARFGATHQYAVSGRHWADLQVRGVSKGQAVRALHTQIGATGEHTAVFGDFHNDIPMLRCARWSFAMANAHPDVIAEAAYVAPSNNEDGVGQVLRRLLGLD